MHTLLTPGDNPGGHAALSAHYAVVLPASPVVRRQISICTAVAVLLSQIWDIRFKVHSRKLTICSAFGIRTPSQLHPGTSSMFFTPHRFLGRWYHDNNTDVLLYTYHCPALLSVAAERL